MLKENSPTLYKIYVSFLKFLPSKQTQYQNQIQIDWIPVSQIVDTIFDESYELYI